VGQCGNESPAQGGGDEVCLHTELSADPVLPVPQFPLQHTLLRGALESRGGQTGHQTPSWAEQDCHLQRCAASGPCDSGPACLHVPMQFGSRLK